MTTSTSLSHLLFAFAVAAALGCGTTPYMQLQAAKDAYVACLHERGPDNCEAERLAFEAERRTFTAGRSAVGVEVESAPSGAQRD